MGEIISKETQLIVHHSESDLDLNTQKLIKRAKEAASNAYAKYSDFLVGAALLLDDGTVVIGNNQENACYPAGLCAERVAFFAAKSQYPNALIEKVAVVARRRQDEHFNGAAPCGSCRQVMAEYEENQGKAIELYLLTAEGKVYQSESIENLLPFKFSESVLNGK